jgi:hypothetical protein
MAMMKARKAKRRYAEGGKIDHDDDAKLVKDPYGIFRGIEKTADMISPGAFSRIFDITTYKDEDDVNKTMTNGANPNSPKSSNATPAPGVASQVTPGMRRGGSVKASKANGKAEKPLYERPRPANMKSKTMTPTQKAAASRIAKASGDKKVGLFARINAMKKVK